MSSSFASFQAWASQQLACCMWASPCWQGQLAALLANMILRQIFMVTAVKAMNRCWRNRDWVEKAMAIYRGLGAGYGVHIAEDVEANFQMFLSSVTMGVWHILGGSLAAPAAFRAFAGCSDAAAAATGWHFSPEVAAALLRHGAITEVSYEVCDTIEQLQRRCLKPNGKDLVPNAALVFLGIHHFMSLTMVLPMNLVNSGNGYYAIVVFLLQFAAGFAVLLQHYSITLRLSIPSELRQMRVISVALFVAFLSSRGPLFLWAGVKLLISLWEEGQRTAAGVGATAFILMSLLNIGFIVDSAHRMKKFLSYTPVDASNQSCTEGEQRRRRSDSSSPAKRSTSSKSRPSSMSRAPTEQAATVDCKESMSRVQPESRLNSEIKQSESQFLQIGQDMYLAEFQAEPSHPACDTNADAGQFYDSDILETATCFALLSADNQTVEATGDTKVASQESPIRRLTHPSSLTLSLSKNPQWQPSLGEAAEPKAADCSESESGLESSDGDHVPPPRVEDLTTPRAGPRRLSANSQMIVEHAGLATHGSPIRLLTQQLSQHLTSCCDSPSRLELKVPNQMKQELDQSKTGLHMRSIAKRLVGEDAITPR